MRIRMFIVLATALTSLTGCGFEPVYGTKSASHNTAQRSGVPLPIMVDTIPGRLGQELRIALEDQFNPEGKSLGAGAYRLSVGLKVGKVPVAIEADGTIARYNVVLDSQYQLTRADTGEKVDSGTLRRIGSYNVTNNADYATFVAENDAIKTTALGLAEDYRLRFSALLSGK